jgi:WD40 repeat protein
MNEVTRVLSAIEQGDPQASDQLLPLVYDELRRLAAQKLAQEKPGQTLEATALVHEAYLRLVDTEQVQHWNSHSDRPVQVAGANRRGRLWHRLHGRAAAAPPRGRLESQQTRHGYQDRGGVTAVAFSADGQRLVTSGADGTARLWDAESGEERLCLQAIKAKSPP